MWPKNYVFIYSFGLEVIYNSLRVTVFCLFVCLFVWFFFYRGGAGAGTISGLTHRLPLKSTNEPIRHQKLTGSYVRALYDLRCVAVT